jgi:GNAT superfamily N-acetyltransferase
MTMLELRPNCECCDRDLPPHSDAAVICSFECTFCVDCAANRLGNRCPNCGGDLQPRPTRVDATLARNPAGTVRHRASSGPCTEVEHGRARPAQALRAGEDRHVEVREAGPADEARWRELWSRYVAFYRAAVPPEVTHYTWSRILDPASPLLCRVALLDGEVVGFCVCVVHEGTWVAAPICYLEDLFVDEAARGSGAGRALIDDLLALARVRGWSRLYWMTQAANTRARALYDSYRRAEDLVCYRLALA